MREKSKAPRGGIEKRGVPAYHALGKEEPSVRTLNEVIEQLPPELQREVEDFAQFLLERKPRAKQRKLRQSWAGGLREFRDRFTSLDLQKRALDQRGERQ
jgi:hypothetical protein